MRNLLDPKITFDITDIVLRSTQAKYSTKSEILELYFHDGSVWRYGPITQSMFIQFKYSRSQVSYFHKYIKNQPHIVAEEVTKGGTPASGIEASVMVGRSPTGRKLDDKPAMQRISAKGKLYPAQDDKDEQKTVEELSRDFHKLIGTQK